MANKLAHLPVSSIRENPVALRPVNKEKQAYISVRDSIATRGVLNPISVIEKKDADTGEVYYELMDGLHRYTGAVESGLETVPCHIFEDLDQLGVLQNQIAANINKVDTKPAQFADAIKRMIALRPSLTKQEIADSVSQSTSWLDARLKLTDLHEDIKELVDNGSIKVSNAVALAKLDQADQVNFVEDAMTKDTAEFGQMCTDRVKEVAAAKREGRDPNEKREFVAVANLRKIAEFKDEVASRAVGPTVCVNAKTALEGFYAGLEWAMSLDSATVTAKKAAFDAKQAAAADKKAKAALAREEKRAEEAQKKAAELREKVAS